MLLRFLSVFLCLQYEIDPYLTIFLGVVTVVWWLVTAIGAKRICDENVQNIANPPCSAATAANCTGAESKGIDLGALGVGFAHHQHMWNRYRCLCSLLSPWHATSPGQDENVLGYQVTL